jgi:hypothetical protein
MCIIHQHSQQVMTTLADETHVLSHTTLQLGGIFGWTLVFHLVSLLGVVSRRALSSRCTAKFSSHFWEIA